MVLISFLLLIGYLIIENLLLHLSGCCQRLSFLRVILLPRFKALGNLIIWLDKGWPSIAVRFVDVLVGVWLVQSLSRIFWQTIGSKSICNLSYSEIIRSPSDSLNGSIFNGFLADPGNLTAFSYPSISYYGENLPQT